VADRCWIFDLGPQFNMAKPVRPVLAADTVEARVELEVDLEEYEKVYRDYVIAERQFQRERKQWEKQNPGGGAVEVNMWSTDAGEALMRDPRRYHAAPAGLKVTARRVM
jgi:hypothetical protein